MLKMSEIINKLLFNSWGLTVDYYRLACVWFNSLPQAPLFGTFHGGKLHSLIPSLYQFCTQSVHSVVLYYTPVKKFFYPPSTPLTMTTTNYIKGLL